MKIKKSITAFLGLMIALCFGAVLAVGCTKPQTYTVTIANYNMVCGSVSLDHSDKIYESGQEATVTVEANEGYSIQSFTVDNEDKLASLNDGVYKFVVQKDVTIAVGFKRDSNPPDDGDDPVGPNPPEEKGYKITVESGENGMVTLLEDKETFKKDEKVTAVLRPSKGYEIKSFVVGDEDYTRKAALDGEYTFAVTGDMTVKATFAPDDLTKTQNVSAKGFKRITDNNEYVLVDFWATWCNACVNYTEPVVKDLAAENLGIKIVKMDIGAYDEYPPERDFFLKYAKMYGNTGNIIPAFVIFKNGQPIAGTHESSPFGYTLDQLREFVLQNIEEQNSGKQTFHTLDCEYETDKCSVTIFPDKDNYEDGEEITVTVTANQGYRISAFFVDGEDKLDSVRGGAYTFNITKNTPVRVGFTEVYSVTILDYDSECGTVQLDKTDGIYDANDEVSISVIPESGNVVNLFKVDGEDKLAFLENKVYKFDITKNTTVQVEFGAEEKGYKITVESGENGVVTLSSDKTSFEEGENVTAILRPNKGYEIKSFVVGDEDYTKKAVLDGEYTFTVMGDMTLKATFAPDDLTKIQNVSVRGFKRITDNNEYVIVDFWATWCNSCVRYTEPELKKVAAENLGIKIVKMDIGAYDENPPEREFFFKYTQMFGNFNTIPAFVIFKNGQPIAGTFETSPFGYTADRIIQFILDNMK